MKKLFSILSVMLFVAVGAQKTSNRFFYELTFKPGVEVDSLHKEMTILDILPEKSVYQDYLMVSQDSILKVHVEQMMKSGTFKDMSKIVKQPKFSYKVEKSYPSMEISYIDQILQNRVSYKETTAFDWKILPENTKIGEYNTQAATTTFGGRNWKAWFSTDIPFQDGPYKFHGLPGLIVKLEDSDKDYSWELKGNKKVENFEEESYSQKLQKQFMGGRSEALVVDREKFEKMYDAYKKDPFGSIRAQLSQIPADAKMPDGTSISQMMKDQEAMLKKYLNENNNSIERVK